MAYILFAPYRDEVRYIPIRWGQAPTLLYVAPTGLWHTQTMVRGKTNEQTPHVEITHGKTNATNNTL